MNRTPSGYYGDKNSVAPYSLKVYTPIKAGQVFVKEITDKARGWQRSIRLNGGYWIGKFTLQGTLAELTDIFYNWLDYHVVESVGGVSNWNGSIYEMTLNTANASRVRSLDQMYNHVRSKYGSSSITSAASIQASIDRYGQKEAIENVGDIDATSAAARRDSYLKERGWPWARPQASGRGMGPSLDVVVCGYVFKMNYRHTTTADDSTSNIGAWISSIRSTDCAEFTYAGSLAANATSIKLTVEDYTRCWDLISKLVKIGDASGNLYRAWMGSSRRFHYEQISTTPLYYIVKGQIQSNLAATESINPWKVQPGVYRDMDYPVSTTEPGSYLADVRDMIVEEVTCGVNSGLSWQALDFSESEQLAALQDAIGAQATPGAGGSVVRSVTDEMLARMGVSRAKWAKMTPTQRRALKKKKLK